MVRQDTSKRDANLDSMRKTVTSTHLSLQLMLVKGQSINSRSVNVVV